MRNVFFVLLLLAPTTRGMTAAASAALDESALLFQHNRYEDALKRLEAPNARETAGDASAQLHYDLLLGLTLRRLGREAEAVVPLARALAAAPADLDVAVNLGLAFQATGQFTDAAKAFKAGASAHPAADAPWLGLGMLAAGRGNWDEARADYDKAVALAPKNAAAWVALSDAMVRQGQLRPAVEAREKALALAPDDHDLLFKQAVGWYGLGEFDKAAAMLAKAQAGDRPDAYFLSGSLAYRRGDLAGAERNFLAALEAQPDYPEARLNLGITYYGLHRYQDAIEQFGQIRSRQTGHDLAVEYARESAQAAVDEALRQGAQAVLAGEFVEAVRQWDRAESLAPDKAAVHKMLASLREQQKPRAEALAVEGERAQAGGDLQKASVAWNEALSIDPDNARAKAGMKAAMGDLSKLAGAYQATGQLLVAQGDLAGAREWVLRLSSVDIKAGLELKKSVDQAVKQKLRVLQDEAAQAQDMDRPEESVGRYDQALALDPLDPRLKAKREAAQMLVRAKVGRQLAKALVLEADGHLQEAYDLQQQALTLEPGNLEARQGTARLAAHLNLKRMDPKAVDDMYYRGVYLYGNGETEKALALWREALVAAPHHGPLLAAVHSAETKLRTLAQLKAR